MARVVPILNKYMTEELGWEVWDVEINCESREGYDRIRSWLENYGAGFRSWQYPERMTVRTSAQNKAEASLLVAGWVNQAIFSSPPEPELNEEKAKEQLENFLHVFNYAILEGTPSEERTRLLKSLGGNMITMGEFLKSL